MAAEAARKQIGWIAPKELQPGDVLLSRGMSKIAELIAYLDGNEHEDSPYCHAALAVGGESLSVIECVDVGFRERSLVESVAGDDPRAFVDVFRWTSATGAPASPEQRQAILAAARKHTGKHAFGRLLLAALVAQQRRKRGREKNAQAHLLGTRLAQELEHAVKDHKAMTCSALVAEAYQVAGLMLEWPVSSTPPLAAGDNEGPTTLGPRQPRRDP